MFGLEIFGEYKAPDDRLSFFFRTVFQLQLNFQRFHYRVERARGNSRKSFRSASAFLLLCRALFYFTITIFYRPPQSKKAAQILNGISGEICKL